MNTFFKIDNTWLFNVDGKSYVELALPIQIKFDILDRWNINLDTNFIELFIGNVIKIVDEKYNEESKEFVVEISGYDIFEAFVDQNRESSILNY